MKKIFQYISCALVISSGMYAEKSSAQGMHFSQYYNAPMLLNPANTGLMSQNDFRLGANYRKQWAQVPIPYNTFSAFADFQAFQNMDYTNWLGIGVAFFNDKAGDGNLALSRTEAFVAYHIQVGLSSMISAGLSASYNQRSVDFSRLTFDTQWDGFKFNKLSSNGEDYNTQQSNFYDIGAGINYAYYPNELVYIKLGVGLAHVNQPIETFYNNSYENRVHLRPTVNLDGLFILNPTFTVNPSVYFTTQDGAQELVYGLQGMIHVAGEDVNSTSVLIGAYNRWQESIVPMFGIQWGGLKFTTSYDYTISKLKNDVPGAGALEISIIYLGLYGSSGGGHGTLNCPRF